MALMCVVSPRLGAAHELLGHDLAGCDVRAGSPDGEADLLFLSPCGAAAAFLHLEAPSPAVEARAARAAAAYPRTFLLHGSGGAGGAADAAAANAARRLGARALLGVAALPPGARFAAAAAALARAALGAAPAAAAARRAAEELAASPDAAAAALAATPLPAADPDERLHLGRLLLTLGAPAQVAAAPAAALAARVGRAAAEALAAFFVTGEGGAAAEDVSSF
jgi:hypothetical protein